MDVGGQCLTPSIRDVRASVALVAKECCKKLFLNPRGEDILFHHQNAMSISVKIALTMKIGFVGNATIYMCKNAKRPWPFRKCKSCHQHQATGEGESLGMYQTMVWMV